MAALRGLSIALAAVFLITGCEGYSTEPDPSPLVGTSWLLEDIDGDGVVEGARSTLAFESETAVRGNTGCNGMQGRAEIEGSTLRIGPLATTRRACPPAIMDQETRYLAALATVAGWRIEAGNLLLFDANGEPRLKFLIVE